MTGISFNFVRQPRSRAGALTLVLVSVWLSGCATQTTQPSEPQPSATSPEVVQVADRPFEMDTLYALLVAEMAGERHRFDVMLSNYVQQAEETADPGITARAARIARYLNAHGPSLDMALRWLELEPDNIEAVYIATAELVHANRLEEALEQAKVLLRRGEVAGLDAIGAKAIQGGNLDTTRALLAEYEELFDLYPNEISLHTGASLLYHHAGQLDQALKSARKAVALDADDFQAAIQEAHVLQQMGHTNQALDKLGALVRSNPDNTRLRLQYARALLKNDLETAQQQFEILQQNNPDDSDILLTLALVEHERGHMDSAKEKFARLVESGDRTDTAHYYLGRIALLQKDQQQALHHFGKVGPGSDYLPAMAQLTELLLAQGKAEQAVALVRDRRADTPTDQQEVIEGLHLLESHLLTTQGAYSRALAQLEEAIQRYPRSARLLYARAMLFTRMDDLVQAERDLKEVLSLSPDNAAALNALGYTLADRTDRLDEAYGYIRKAYRLTPDDPAVIDSLGWVEYRRGNHQAALENLRRAMEALPDHEIAAHLGEVLWVTGEHREAQKVWQQGLELKPDSTVITETMDRLNAEPK